MATPAWADVSGTSSTPSATAGDTSWLTSTNDEETPPALSSAEMASPDVEKKSSQRGRGLPVFLFIISTLFLAVFVYSLIEQRDDKDGFLWMLFYGFHAALAAAFIVYRFICFPEKIVYGLAASMLVWSSILIVIASIKLSDTESGGSKAGGDDSEMTEREEIVFEVAGAAVGWGSAFWHAMMVRCCGANNSEKYDPGEEADSGSGTIS
mmetsp:Transcript_10289/g.15839  ORF Transcript_10289/g.15839 Transcript_10289/m.15839 type:complete len:209 (-) Transcript_10289:2562-3188(-)